jgi:hypothetical protein
MAIRTRIAHRGRRTAATIATASIALTGGVLVAGPPQAAQAAGSATAAAITVVTPNPWYEVSEFKGFGTSLAWLANATGSYGADGNQYGRALREEFYQSLFGSDGLDLNIARYNIGGGNASDVAYSYPFMRQGANVPGYWRDDATGTGYLAGTGATTKQADRAALLQAFDPMDDASYDFDKDAAQQWWLTRAMEGTDGQPDVDVWEAFVNSAPYFMTESGYATGGIDDASANNLDPQAAAKFAQYLAHVIAGLESRTGVNFDTVEPFNESEANYWPTPGTTASDYVGTGDANDELISRYTSELTGKDLSLTPYASALKKPQEGMRVFNTTQQLTLEALGEALAGNTDTVVSATDASVAQQLVDSYMQYDQAAKDVVEQLNVHGYGTNGQTQVRDLGKSEDKPVSMSEVDGDFSGSSFNPFLISNGLGFANKINNDVYGLESNDFVMWQAVEDLYNMQLGSGQNPAGENLNWGTVFIDFDCTVTGADGKLYSKRRVDVNNGSTTNIQPCHVLANSKFNAVRNYTQFVHSGDSVIANSSTADNFTAQSADGSTLTVVHTNNSAEPQTVVVDLSKYADIAEDATATPYVTTETPKDIQAQGPEAATIANLRTTGNVRGEAVEVDRAAKTATITVPAESISSIVVDGVSGVASDAAALADGGTYQLTDHAGVKALSDVASGSSAASMTDLAGTAEQAGQQQWTFHEVPSDNRPTLKRYVIQDRASGRYLTAAGTANGSSVALTEYPDPAAAAQDPTALWNLNTRDGSTYTLVSGLTALSSDNALLYLSDKSDTQEWRFRSIESTGVVLQRVQTPRGTTPSLPTTVVPTYGWGQGTPIPVEWDAGAVAQAIAQTGTYQIPGRATDVFGNAVTAALELHVGDLTIADPASVTVAAGSTLEQVRNAAPTQVGGRLGTSEPIQTPVTWDFSGVTDSDFADAGSVVRIPGQAPAGDGRQLPTSLAVLVTAAGERNAAPEASSFTPSYSETGTSRARAGLTNGNRSDKAWTTWSSSTRPGPETALWTFSTPQQITHVTTSYYRDGRASWPATLLVEYQSAEGAWHTCGSEELSETDASAPVIDIACSANSEKRSADSPSAAPAEASAVRLTHTLRPEKTYISVSEIEIFVPDPANPAPASTADLADLRIGGASVKDFDPDVDEYTSSLPPDATAYPLVQAVPLDQAAEVEVVQATGQSPATITVTSADGSASRTYALSFEGTPLVGIEIAAPPSRASYTPGEELDLDGLVVQGVHEDGSRHDIAEQDLTVSGFDPSVVGQQWVSVDYAGFTARFQVIVAAPTTPAPSQNPSSGGTDAPSSGGIVAAPSADGNASTGGLAATGSTAGPAAAVAGFAVLLGLASIAAGSRRRGESAR